METTPQGHPSSLPEKVASFLLKSFADLNIDGNNNNKKKHYLLDEKELSNRRRLVRRHRKVVSEGSLPSINRRVIFPTIHSTESSSTPESDNSYNSKNPLDIHDPKSCSSDKKLQSHKLLDNYNDINKKTSYSKLTPNDLVIPPFKGNASSSTSIKKSIYESKSFSDRVIQHSPLPQSTRIKNIPNNCYPKDKNNNNNNRKQQNTANNNRTKSMKIDPSELVIPPFKGKLSNKVVENASECTNNTQLLDERDVEPKLTPVLVSTPIMHHKNTNSLDSSFSDIDYKFIPSNDQTISSKTENNRTLPLHSLYHLPPSYPFTKQLEPGPSILRTPKVAIGCNTATSSSTTDTTVENIKSENTSSDRGGGGIHNNATFSISASDDELSNNHKLDISSERSILSSLNSESSLDSVDGSSAPQHLWRTHSDSCLGSITEVHESRNSLNSSSSNNSLLNSLPNVCENDADLSPSSVMQQDKITSPKEKLTLYPPLTPLSSSSSSSPPLSQEEQPQNYIQKEDNPPLSERNSSTEMKRKRESLVKHLSHQDMPRKQIRFDPRVWVHEFDQQTSEDIWFSRVELARFRYEALNRIRDFSESNNNNDVDDLSDNNYGSQLIATGTGRIIPVSSSSSNTNNNSIFPSKVLFTNPALSAESEEDDEICGGTLYVFPNAHNPSVAKKEELIRRVIRDEIKSILIVDTHDIFLRLLTKGILSIFPHANVTTAHDAIEASNAIQIAKQKSITDGNNDDNYNTHGFDIIIIEERLRFFQNSKTKSLSDNDVGHDSEKVRNSHYPVTGSVFIHQLRSEYLQILHDMKKIDNEDNLSKDSNIEDNASITCPRFPLLVGMSAYIHHDEYQLKESGSDFVWGKPPPPMDQELRNEMLRFILIKRGRKNLGDIFG